MEYESQNQAFNHTITYVLYVMCEIIFIYFLESEEEWRLRWFGRPRLLLVAVSEDVVVDDDLAGAGWDALVCGLGRGHEGVAGRAG